MELNVLGPLELRHHGRQWPLGSPKEQCVLAVLGAAEGEPVTMATLMDRVWGDRPPPSAAATLHSYLSRLRGRLKRASDGEAGLERPSPRSYRLRIAPEAVDLTRFRRLRGQARDTLAEGELERAIGRLREAERLWRGEPLGEFTGMWAETFRARLHEDLRAVREERIRIELRLGRHADLIGELRALVDEEPLAQGAVAHLMVALYRCGRPDESLSLYRTTRSRLDDELGLAPSPELHQLHQRVLEQDPSLDLPADEPVQTVRAEGGPNHLPYDNRDFTGRDDELRGLLTQPDPDGTAPALTVVHGMAGVGKSVLVIHAAHRLRDRYPDGLFYVNLRAHSDQPPCAPSEALTTLEDAADRQLAEGRTSSFDARAARWRDWLAHRRALLVLDDAGSAEQVRPLLPGGAGCQVFITSRHQLAPLDGARPVGLEVLSVAEAVSLFTRVVGVARARDSEALHRVVSLCGYLPLAIQLTAHRFRHRDSWDLQDLVDRLTQAADLLEEIDIHSGIATAFRLSYDQLGDGERKLFRSLALHPGPDLTLSAAVALVDADAARLRRGLEELLTCHLLEEPVRGRYRFHDLVRGFAVRVSTAEEPERMRQEAVRRLLTHYLTAADHADRMAHPQSRRIAVPPELRYGDPPEFTDADEAAAWLDVERRNLLAAAHEAAASSPELATLFLHALGQSFKRWGAWETAAELHDSALAFLRTRGDTRALAHILMERSDIQCHEHCEEALRCAEESLAIFRELADRQGEADALFQAGRAHLAAGRRTTSLECLDRALALYRRTGDRHGEAEALNVQGVALHFAGELDEALKRFHAVYRIQKVVGDLHGQATALLNAGEIHRLETRFDEARDLYERALALARRTGVRRQLVNLYTNLGNVCRATGQTDEALAYFRKALSSYRASRDPRSEANTLLSMGTAYHEAHQERAAMEHFTMAERIARRIGNLYERQSALIGIAALQRTSGQYTAALKTYEEALEVAREIEIPLGMAQAHDGIAQTVLHTHGAEAAERHARRALALYERLGVAEEAERVRRSLIGR
ncbi:AfsR/SARP family transcriptional regulator [Streptomyces antioxidans]|uniref:AfsR/SARP family transcriptional regulator n=1 Tax=Streptomyces antioxidans TaxID=1507734 RepID=UPI000D1B6C9A|nr:BTAD domain-containing putative transcriptional regulator [Streptomyces antioxidans]